MINVTYINDTLSKRQLVNAQSHQYCGASIHLYEPVGPWTGVMLNDAWVADIDAAGVADGDTLIFVKTDEGDALGDALGGFGMVGAIFNPISAITQAGFDLSIGIDPLEFNPFTKFSQIMQKFMGVPTTPGLPGFGPGPGDGGSTESSGTYSFGEIQTQLARNQVWPIVFGEHLYGGIILYSYTLPDPDGIDRVFTLVAVSEGPIESIGGYTTNQDELTADDLPSSLRINKLTASGITDLKVSFRLGGPDQTLMRGFESLVGTYDVDVTLDEDVVFDYTTRNPVTRLLVNIFFPTGLRGISLTSGNNTGASVTLNFQVIDVDTDVVVHDVDQRISHARQYGFSHMQQVAPLPLKTYRVLVKRVSPIPPRYKTNNRTSDKCVVNRVTEDTGQQVAWNHKAVVGFEIRAQEQVQGRQPQFEIPVRGVKCTFKDQVDVYTDNPSHIAEHYATNRLYGLGPYGIEAGDIDRVTFDDLADDADELVNLYTGSDETEPRYRYNRVLDTATNGWEFLIEILATCRSFPLKSGNIVKVVQNKAKPFKQLFNSQNIAENTMAVRSQGKISRPNAITLYFADERLRYQQNSIDAEVPGIERSDDLLDAPRSKEVRMPGITSPYQAKREASYRLRLAQRVRDSVTFTTGTNAIGSEPGDVIAVSIAHLDRQALADGTVIEADVSTCRIDTEVDLVDGYVYQLTTINLDTGYVQENKFQQVGDETTDTLPIGGLDVYTAYILRRQGTRIGYYVFSGISYKQNNTQAEIQAFQYDPSIYTDDAAPVEEVQFEPIILPPPDPVENLIVANEQLPFPGTSNIRLTWTPPSAGPDVRFYRVHILWPTTDGYIYQQVGTTEGLEFTVPNINPDVRDDLGYPVSFVVVSIGLDLSQLSVEDSARVDYNLRRDEEFNQLADFPGDPSNLQYTDLGDGHARLTWDAATNADGYDIRMGSFEAGVLIGAEEYATRTVDVYIGGPKEIYLRAYKDVGGARYYSGGFERIYIDDVIDPDFDDAVAGPFENIAPDQSGSSIEFGQILPYFRGKATMVQVNADSQFAAVWTSVEHDLGSSAETMVSISPRGIPIFSQQAGESFFGPNNMTFAGPMRSSARQLQRTYFAVEYSDTPGGPYSIAGTFGNGVVFNQRITVTGRYIRIKVYVLIANPIADVASFGRLIDTTYGLYRPS